MVQKNTIYWDKTKPAKAGGNPLCQATEQPIMCFRMPAFSLSVVCLTSMHAHTHTQSHTYTFKILATDNLPS